MTHQPIYTARNPSPARGKRAEGTARRPSGRMVLCLGQLPQAAVIERYFQERGWKVLLAPSGYDARTMARKSGASVVVLAEESPAQESGWLTCWKLLSEMPNAQVIVVGSRSAEEGCRLAEFVGASAYVPATESALGIDYAMQESSLSI